MLTISEIHNNQKKVSFSYGEDTVTILYRPFVAKMKWQYKRIQFIAKLVDKGKLKARRLHLAFLKLAIIDMNYTLDGELVEIPRNRIRMFDDLFLHKLYKALTDEVIYSTRERISAELKKK
jgi:hypothetical protein